MTFGDSGPTMTAAGSTVAITSALVAQQSGADVGNAAIVVAAGGLITGFGGIITQLFKLWLDAQKVRMDQQGWADRVKKLEDDLAGSRQRRHQDASRFNGILMEQQAETLLAKREATEAAIRVAKLEGQLGVIDRTHAEGINLNSKNIDIVAARSGIPLPEHPPPVEPIVSPEANHLPEVLDPSDDDISPFFRH